MGAAAAELAGADPGGGDSWRGVAREGFVAARSLAHGRLITAADAASDAASMAERAAELAALGV